MHGLSRQPRHDASLARSVWGESTTIQAAWFEPPGQEQLYDLHDDPHEVTNLAADPDYADVLGQLSQQLDDFLSRVGDTSEYTEHNLPRAISGQWSITKNAASNRDLAGRQSTTAQSDRCQHWLSPRI